MTTPVLLSPSHRHRAHVEKDNRWHLPLYSTRRAHCNLGASARPENDALSAVSVAVGTRNWLLCLQQRDYDRLSLRRLRSPGREHVDIQVRHCGEESQEGRDAIGGEKSKIPRARMAVHVRSLLAVAPSVHPSSVQ
jgi:hypothetical protein